MGEGFSFGHMCAGCPRSKTLHSPSTCFVNRPQTENELAAQGLKRVRGRDGKERIIEIPHSLVQTLFYGVIGLFYRAKLDKRINPNDKEPADNKSSDPLGLLTRGFILQTTPPPIIYPDYGVTKLRVGVTKLNPLFTYPPLTVIAK